jgi:hypothetical protein
MNPCSWQLYFYTIDGNREAWIVKIVNELETEEKHKRLNFEKQPENFLKSRKLVN